MVGHSLNQAWNASLGRRTEPEIVTGNQVGVIKQNVQNELNRLHSVADAAIMAGRFAEAENAYTAGLKMLEAMSGASVAESHACLANSYALLLKNFGRYQECEKWLVQAINMLETEQGEPGLLGHLYNHLGRLYQAYGSPQNSLPMHEKACELMSKGGSQADLSEVLISMGFAASLCKDHEKAARSFERAVEVQSKMSLTPSRRKLETHICAASALLHVGRYNDAEKHCCQALEMRVLLGCEGVDEASLWNMLGYSFAHRRQLTDATQAYRSALRVISESLVPDPLDLADSHFNLAALYAVQGEDERFDYHLAHAANLIDSHSNHTKMRDAHFRATFERHYIGKKPTLKARDLPEVLLLTAPAALGTLDKS